MKRQNHALVLCPFVHSPATPALFWRVPPGLQRCWCSPKRIHCSPASCSPQPLSLKQPPLRPPPDASSRSRIPSGPFLSTHAQALVGCIERGGSWRQRRWLCGGASRSLGAAAPLIAPSSHCACTVRSRQPGALARARGSPTCRKPSLPQAQRVRVTSGAGMATSRACNSRLGAVVQLALPPGALPGAPAIACRQETPPCNARHRRGLSRALDPPAAAPPSCLSPPPPSPPPPAQRLCCSPACRRGRATMLVLATHTIQSAPSATVPFAVILLQGAAGGGVLQFGCHGAALRRHETQAVSGCCRSCCLRRPHLQQEDPCGPQVPPGARGSRRGLQPHRGCSAAAAQRDARNRPFRMRCAAPNSRAPPAGALQRLGVYQPVGCERQGGAAAVAGRGGWVGGVHGGCMVDAALGAMAVASRRCLQRQQPSAPAAQLKSPPLYRH